MTTNIGFDDGHPYLELGANEGALIVRGGRLAVVSRFEDQALPARLATSTAAEFERLAREATTALYRSGTGEYKRVRVSDLKISPARRIQGQPEQAGISFTIERVS